MENEGFDQWERKGRSSEKTHHRGHHSESSAEGLQGSVPSSPMQATASILTCVCQMDIVDAARTRAIAFRWFVYQSRSYAPNKQVVEQKKRVFVITAGIEDADTRHHIG